MHTSRPPGLDRTDNVYHLEEYLLDTLAQSSIPDLTIEKAQELAQQPVGVDKSLWVYEWVR